MFQKGVDWIVDPSFFANGLQNFLSSEETKFWYMETLQGTKLISGEFKNAEVSLSKDKHEVALFEESQRVFSISTDAVRYFTVEKNSRGFCLSNSLGFRKSKLCSRDL